ncbi:hypothetical protein BN2476_590116 [Paraburkholderia piptadeniae]|uniref:Uncharacterized protein n=1 Tax=Paraburkholderia piptadeniae TaxID=1701573 RepID=A0A1N7SK37_9BURK|nr:hypothetical protein BN2476_590116 [Paraburkholderia piptadeniae]
MLIHRFTVPPAVQFIVCPPTAHASHRVRVPRRDASRTRGAF